MSAPVELGRSYLVQRLNQPQVHAFAGMKDNPFSFGGGLAHGGLSANAMDLLRPIFSFDYMGASEFEWGAVPEALQQLAAWSAKSQLTTSTFTVPLAEVPPDFRDKSATPEGEASIYALAHRDVITQVVARINKWARVEFVRDLMEALNLRGALRPFNDWDGRTQGWLELDNGFMFFTDEAMWAATCDLLAVPR